MLTSAHSKVLLKVSAPISLNYESVLLLDPLTVRLLPCFGGSPSSSRVLIDLSDDIGPPGVKKSRRRARADFIAEVAAPNSPSQDHISTLKTSE